MTSAPARRGGYGGPYALETNAFGGNVFHDVASYGNYDTAGRRNARFMHFDAMYSGWYPAI